jgi:hypothetical protein
VEKILAGCWRSQFFGRSRPVVAAIPGTSAGRLLCPWPTQIDIPTTLAPKLAKSHGTAWGFGGFFSSLKFTRVHRSPRDSHPAGKSFEFKILRISPAVSGQVGSQTKPAGGSLMAASRRPVPRDLNPRGLDPGTTCPHAAVSRPVGSGPLIFCGNRGGCNLGHLCGT